nr:hypothetical protein [candidate division KSB1 bacterium]NIS23996.1 hypothetical protein [candidate division KSB1 bacterium]NIT70921.1 hypothetical protein [candidate division KSB1 bacterium]NIU91460.1 hypothetical protein [candidate division KSB1 bacterium]NIW18512.1 hypothetical protein [candidate division KSB1 bacterium]
MQKILADTKAQRERLDDFFVHSTHVVDFIQEIERLGGVAGVETVISNLDEQDNRLSFSVKTEGTYTQVTHFMMLLDAL